MPDLYLTTQQVARWMGVSDQRIRHLLSEGRIIGARKHGRDWLIPSPVKIVPVPMGRRPKKPA